MAKAIEPHPIEYERDLDDAFQGQKFDFECVNCGKVWWQTVIEGVTDV